ncbi:MAG: DUF4442 domain-containing protein [Acidobacteriota bacterium]
MSRRLNTYPPFLGAGIRVVRFAPDLTCFDVRMKLRWWNRNVIGTHFGGSLYMMCDPFYVLILIAALGEDHVVWDKAARIRFWRPGRGTVYARFHVPPEEIAEIRRLAAEQDKVEPTYVARVVDDRGKIVAQVEKELHVRRR